MPHRILVIDNCPATRGRLRSSLAPQHEILCLESGLQWRQQVEQFRPELILLDYRLRDESSLEICSAIRNLATHTPVELLVIGDALTEAERLEAFEAGADDVLEKSIGQLELLAKIGVHLRLRKTLARAISAERKLAGYSQELERIVEARSMAIQSTQDIAVFALAKLADSRDTETGEHLVRMRAYTQMIAEQLQIAGPYQELIDDLFLQDLYRSSPLHDIGKVGVSDAILLKPGGLTDEEFAQMKKHVTIGAETLEEAARSSPNGSFFHMAAQIARYHHERWDGRGYCEGRRGADIPLPARIVSVADVFDALTSKRVYKDAIPPAKAREMILQERGRQFDPAIVDAFDQVYEKLVAFSTNSGGQTRFESASRASANNYHWGKHAPASELAGGEKVLVVDSGSAALQLIATWLSDAGLEVRCCTDCPTAMRLIREECPQLIITDWIIDQEAGESFYRWIREERLPQYVYTLVIAEQTPTQEWAQAYRAGVDEVFSSQISRGELLSRLHSAVRVIELENHLRTVERNDPLTGLATLRYLNDQLKREWHRAQNYRLPLSCIVIDIDDFSVINRQHGAQWGDRVLQQLAKTIGYHCRSVDYLCRLERDRMLVVLPECGEVSAYRIAKRIEMAVDNTRIDAEGVEIRCTVSMGVAEKVADVASFEALIDDAKLALQVAKRSGKRRVSSAAHCRRSSGEAPNDEVRRQLEHRTVSEIMTTPIVNVQESDTLAQAVQLLLKHGFNSAPVVDSKGILVGVISEKDLMQSLRQPAGWETPVAEVMRRDVVRFEESEPAIQVFEFLSHATIRRVVIVQDGRPTGVVSRGNCLRSIQPTAIEKGVQPPEPVATLLDSGMIENTTLSKIREILEEFQGVSGSFSQAASHL